MSDHPKTFNFGSQPLARTTVRDDDGDLADPTTIQLRVRRPKTATQVADFVTVAVTSHPSVGIYTFRFPLLDRVGVWAWIVEATEGIVDTDEDTFEVPPSPFA